MTKTLGDIKSKFQKNDKNTQRYHHFTHVYHKLCLDEVWFLRYAVRWMDRWTDRRTDGWIGGWTDEWTDGRKK